MIPELDSRAKATVWAGALASALIGAAILFDAMPGINWPIWVASAAAAVILARRSTGHRVGTPVFILLGWAVLLAAAVAVTADEGIRALVILSDAMLLGLAIIVTGSEAWGKLSAQLLVTVPVLAPFRVGSGTLRELSAAPSAISSGRSRPVVRGLIITIPIVIILFALLRNADPIIAWTWDRIRDLLPAWSFSTRVVFFLFLLALTLGAASVSARQVEPRLPSLKEPITGRATLGVLEQRMILGAVAVVLWLFVLLQATYLIHSPPSALGSGITFADYARRGFGELSIAVTFVGAVILLMETTRPKDVAAPALVYLEVALLIALELILLSAFRRVVLYEQAYGFTTARVFAQAYMIAIGLALVALWSEIGRGGISVNFARRVSVIALGAFTVLAFWNFQGWIQNRNIDRAVVTGKFDWVHARRLALDALPPLIERRAQLPAEERRLIEGWLGCRPLPEPRRWFEVNAREAAARSAMERSGLYSGKSPCVRPAPPVGRITQ